ncbi:hypothetical protein pb186bvf_007764 [Paramecium bursaria]
MNTPISFSQRISQLALKEDLGRYEQLIDEIIDNNQFDGLIQCLNNLAATFNKYDFNNIRQDYLAKKILKFTLKYLSNNRNKHLVYITRINLAKIYMQIGRYDKAYLHAEKSLMQFEVIALESIKNNKNPQPEVVLLVNGYLLLVKSYRCVSSTDLIRIHEQSSFFQLKKQFKPESFIENAKRLCIKYLGQSHPITIKLTWPKPKPGSLFPKFSQSVQKSVAIKIEHILKKVKTRLQIKGNFRTLTSSVETISIRHKTQNTEIGPRKLRQKRKITETQTHDSDETTKDIQNTANTKFIEQLIQSQFELQSKQLPNHDKEQTDLKENIKKLTDQLESLTKQFHNSEEIQKKQYSDLQDYYSQQIKSLEEKNNQLSQQIKQTQISAFQIGPDSSRLNTAKYKSLCENDLSCQFVDQLSNITINFTILPDFIYKTKVTNEFEYDLELQFLVKNNSNEFFLKIRASNGGESPLKKQEIFEILDQQTLQEALSLTKNQHQLPFPIRLITDQQSFIQYLIVPFIQIEKEKNDQKIAVFPYPQGVLAEIKQTFYEAPCFWWLYHLEQYKFRVSLFTNNLQPKLNFHSINKLLSHILNYFNLNIDEKQIQLPCVRIKDVEGIKQFINVTIIEVQDYFQQLNIHKLEQFDKANQSFIKLLVVRVENHKKCLIFVQDTGQFTVQLKNLWQSHAPDCLTFAQGNHLITRQFISDQLGIDWDRLDIQDKLYLLQQIQDMFQLETFDKKLELDDYDIYKENAITIKPFDPAGYKNLFIGDNYKSPINMTLLSFRQIPRILRITSFNIDNTYQNGILFFINAELYAKQITEQKDLNNKKKKQKKYQTNTLKEQYNSQDFLNEDIFRQVVIDPDQQIFLQQNDKILQLSRYM